MKRRKFVYTSLLGVVGLSKLYASPLLDTQRRQTEDFSFLLKKLGAKRHNIALLYDISLQTAYQKSIKSWTETGFQAFDSHYYSCQEEKIAIFPLKLSHSRLGLIDTALLCLVKANDGEWHSVTSLSGFHIEALTMMIQELDTSDNSNQWAERILPSIAAKNKYIPFGYTTLNGEINLKVSLTSVEAKVEAKFDMGNNIIWEKNYASQNHSYKPSFLT